MRIVSIVEGHGDQFALPLLIRRLAAQFAPRLRLDVAQPIRIPRTRLLKAGELERAVELAAASSGPTGGILIVIDADDDCPATLAGAIRDRAVAARRDRRIGVVLAKREFESWFLAASESLAGRRDLRPDLTAPADPEAVRDAKGWLTARSRPGRPYKETLDQPALVEIMSLEQARRASSFRKLCRELETLITPGSAEESHGG